jgi:predicted metalloenzyme YecM
MRVASPQHSAPQYRHASPNDDQGLTRKEAPSSSFRFIEVVEPFNLDGQAAAVLALLEEVSLKRVEVLVIAHRVRVKDTEPNPLIALANQDSWLAIDFEDPVSS